MPTSTPLRRVHPVVAGGVCLGGRLALGVLFAIGLSLATISRPVHAQAIAAESAEFQAAVARYQDKDWQGAASAFQAYLHQAPDVETGLRARFFLAESRFQLGEYDRAYPLLTLLASELEGGPIRPRVLFRLGQTAYFLGRSEEARRRFGELANDNPRDPLVPYSLPYLAEMAAQNGRLEEAASIYARAIDALPAGATADNCRLEQAECCRQLGQADTARQLLNRLRSSANAQLAAEALYALATLEYAERSYEAAGRCFEEFLERFPQHHRAAEAHYWLGIVCYVSRNYAEAADQLAQAEAQLDSRRLTLKASCWLFLAESLERSGRLDEARDFYTRLVEQAPDHRRAEGARCGLQRLEVAANPSGPAAEQAPSAEPVPETPSVAEQLRGASRLADQQRWAEALNVVEQLLAAMTTDSEFFPDTTLVAGRCLIELGHGQAARQQLEALLVESASITPSQAAEGQFLIARSYREDGDPGRAAREFLRLDALASDHFWREQGVREASRCYESLGRHEASDRLAARADSLGEARVAAADRAERTR